MLSIALILPLTAQAQDRQLTQEDDAQTRKRVALVIGNGDYANARKLANPVNDANDMAKALRDVGFEVVSGTNLSLKQMSEKVREFGDKLKASGGVGLFYYAGHGVQVNNRNYLIPVEADISREDEIDFAALNFDIVLRKMATANNGLNIVILDACRNNPFARSWSRGDEEGGLAQINAPTGTFIAYATSPDKTADDGAGRNGLYTAELLKYIKQPNMKIEETFKEVRKAVKQASGGKQIPWDSSSLSGEFYFKKSEIMAEVTKNGKTEPVILAKDKAAQEEEAWDLVKNSASASDFRYYLEEFPDGANAAAAKIRLEELVWQTVRGSDKAKIQAYLKEFPNGANASAARIRIKQIEESANVTTNPTTTGNTTTPTRGTVRKNSIGMDLVYIPPGEFMMGSTDSEISEALYEAKNANKISAREWFSIEAPKHKVNITNGFWMGKFEITQKQWELIMGNNPSDYKDCGGGECPVEQVSWYDVQAFLKKLNANDSQYIYRLPTEAEWEYACRAGTTTTFAFGNTLSSKQARFDGRFPWSGAEKGDFTKKTASVGSFQPNAWGLYDMHGNVWEWVEDWYGQYTEDELTNPTGPKSGEYKVIRGGSWVNFAALVRSAIRAGIKPDFREANGFANPLKRLNIGFRVVAIPK